MKIAGRDYGQVSMGNRVRADLDLAGVHLQQHLHRDVSRRVEEPRDHI